VGYPTPEQHEDALMSSFPQAQLVPQPLDRVDFQIDGASRLTYHYSPLAPRPFLYPLIGPAGRPLTRLGHPHDPMGHRHHRSIWTGHKDINGLDFWGEDPGNHIRFERLVELADGDVSRLVAEHRWIDREGTPHLTERWSVTCHDLPKGELLVELQLEYAPVKDPVVLGKTPFGFLGIRVAKTMSVNDGGGKVLNDSGAVNEPEVHWKRARWVDYSGPVAPGVSNGITFMDASENPRHPNFFHVRNDGWIGHSFCFAEPFKLPTDGGLRLRLGLYAHQGAANPQAIERTYEWWTGESGR
jgi:hypothetical protein